MGDSVLNGEITVGLAGAAFAVLPQIAGFAVPAHAFLQGVDDAPFKQLEKIGTDTKLIGRVSAF